MAAHRTMTGGSDPPYHDRFVRQIGILGDEGQRRIASTSLAIVGTGGNGSAIALLCGLAGFRTMYLVDADRLEIHNLNRFMLGGVRDVGKCKVLVAKRTLHRLFPGMTITALPEAIQANEAWERVSACHWLIDATDSDETRRFLQEKCAEHGLPLVSLASGFVTRDGRVVIAGCRVNRVRPGDACLACQVLAEQPMQQAQISLAVPNMVAAALALDMLLREITGYADQARDGTPGSGHGLTETVIAASDSANFIMFDLFARTLHAQRVIPSPGCPTCERINGARQEERSAARTTNLERDKR